jgi:KaiC/GvpD/RAD55 family RecA-like ATPase
MIMNNFFTKRKIRKPRKHQEKSFFKQFKRRQQKISNKRRLGLKKRISNFRKNAQDRIDYLPFFHEKTISERYSERIQKIENLIEKMESKKENEDISFTTTLKQEDTSIKTAYSPEFLETNPFQFPVIAPQPPVNTSKVIEGTISPGFQHKSSAKIDLTGGEPTIAESFDEIVPTQNEKENDSFPLISEMELVENKKRSMKHTKRREWLFTGIDGFDELLEKGIPTGSNVIIAGGPGCGKTIFCSQVLYNKALEGKDCVFLSMEERPDRLRDHMREFGFNVTEVESSQEQIILRANGKGKIALKRLQPIRLARSIEALLEKASGTLPVDIDLVLDFIPKDFTPYLLVLDSLSAIETAFSGTKRQYRIYIEQLFRYFEELDITTFMITESSDAPHKFSSSGVEEFLADGIFVFYNFPGVKKRTRGIEIYKLRGASHSQKIMSMNITGSGIEIVPDQPK